MAAISPNDPQLFSRGLAASSSPTSATAAPAAGPQQGPAQAGFSGKDSFAPADPVEGTINGQNSQAQGRADLVNGQFQVMDGLMAKSNAAWSWHKLKMEMIALLRPS